MTRRSFLASCGKIGAMAALGGLGAGMVGCAEVDEFFSGVRKIEDSIGRVVEIPSANKLSRVYFTSPLAQVFCLTMAPDLIAGTTVPFTADQLEYLPIGTENLDNMGSLSGGGAIDVEALHANGVQIIFSISGTDLTDVNINDALALQEQSGIPVVLIDGSFDKIAETYQLLGECLGRRERALELGSYCADIYDRVTAAVASVPDEERVSYFFAEGEEGLLSEPDVSQHSLAFLAAGGVNVAADVDPDEEGRRAGTLNNHDMVHVTLDEVRAWDPDYIISWDYASRSGASKRIRTNALWADIRAVSQGKVFTMPNLPFAFCDRPPGVNRFLGIQWLANLFYPSYYDVDMVQTVRDFYSTCYWRNISEEQARAVLNPD